MPPERQTIFSRGFSSLNIEKTLEFSSDFDLAGRLATIRAEIRQKRLSPKTSRFPAGNAVFRQFFFSANFFQGDVMEHKLDLVGQNQVLGVLAVGGTLKMAAELVGCSQRAIDYAARRDRAFRDNILKNRNKPELICLRTMTEAASNYSIGGWKPPLRCKLTCYQPFATPARFGSNGV